jgi:hypothetical protein
MDKDRDLLPWIFGGLSTAAVAIAITVGSTNGIAPKSPQAPSPITAHILPEAETAAAPAPPPSPAPAMATAQRLAATQIQPVTSPTEPNGQVWECTINGQKTFSDSPCGSKSSLHEIGPVNGMDATPMRSYGRSYAPPSGYQPDDSYQGDQEDSSPGEQQSANSSYPVFVGIPAHGRARPDHAHRPHSDHHGPVPRKN